MRLDQGQSQLGHLAGKRFEAAVFLGPLFDLGDQRDRYVDGAGFGFNLPGEIVAGMLVAAGTTAVGITTGATESDQAGGQQGAFGLEFLLAGLEGSADQRRMFWHFHSWFRPVQLAGDTE
jgi:hypothetical protein